VRTTVNQVREDGTGLNELTKLVDDGSLKLCDPGQLRAMEQVPS
jgi:hypothetical protein